MHVCVEDADASGSAVIVHEDDEGVFADAPFVEFAEDASDVFVDVMNHAEEALRVFGEVLVGIQGLIFGACVIRAVRGVCWDVGEKGFAGFVLGFNPSRGLCVKHVRAVAFRFFESSVVEDGWVEVGVCGGVAAGARVDLTNPASAVDESLPESASVWLVSRFVSEVPLSEDSGGIPGLAEHLCERYGFERHAFALEDGVGDAVFELVPSCEQGAACGCASWADMEVGESQRFRPEFVEVGGFEDGVAVG